MKAYTLSAAERDTVLAALRLWQEPRAIESLGKSQRIDLETIATNCGRHSMMDTADVDKLCERINT